MNSKNIKRHLKAKIKDWIESIENEEIRETIEKNVIVTGGAIVSLLTGEAVNDYDVYFKDYDSCLSIAKYYAGKWNSTQTDKPIVYVIPDTEVDEIERKLDTDSNLYDLRKGHIEDLKEDTERDKRISFFIRSVGVTPDDEIDPDTEEAFVEESTKKKEKGRYRPMFFSSNAISLSDKIQIVVRFYGDIDSIHKNYDFVHCTCSYDYFKNELTLPSKALECIINKELHYIGSKYPLCSIIRTRKFLKRGYHINAGQYLKMALQLNELDLHDFDVMRDQLTGVDSAYFEKFICAMEEMKKKKPDFSPDSEYYFDAINRIFG